MVSCAQLQTSIEALTKLLTDSVLDIKKITNENKDELLDKITTIGTRLDKVDTRLDNIEEHLVSSDEHLDKVEEAANLTREDVLNLEERIRLLEKDNELLKALPTNIKYIEEMIEERTNRQLRETLIIRNVPERNPDETYTQTKELLAGLISEHIEDVSYEYAYSQIKRAHRESLRRNDEINYRQGKRIIFAGLHSWDLCEKMIETFRLKCIRDSEFKISVDQKYGPLTTKRRRKALERRKELKENSSISGGFIDFPAKLMVNFPNDVDGLGKKIYKLHTNFSKMDVKIIAK